MFTPEELKQIEEVVERVVERKLDANFLGFIELRLNQIYSATKHLGEDRTPPAPRLRPGALAPLLGTPREPKR